MISNIIHLLAPETATHYILLKTISLLYSKTKYSNIFRDFIVLINILENQMN